MAILIAAVITVAFFLVLGHMVFRTAEPRYRMTPEEEAKYEQHPTLTPYTTEITAENVRDIINVSIEDGIEHPALALRKALN